MYGDGVGSGFIGFMAQSLGYLRRPSTHIYIYTHTYTYTYIIVYLFIYLRMTAVIVRLHETDLVVQALANGSADILTRILASLLRTLLI